jgi:hypothetical protein
MDDQRDYAEEAANQREMEREGLAEAIAEAEQRVIASVRQVIAAGRDRGDTSGGILGQVESLLDGAAAVNAGTREHIDRVTFCAVCGERVEHIAGIRDPYWRHVGDSTGRPHVARPEVAVGTARVAPPAGPAAHDTTGSAS